MCVDDIIPGFFLEREMFQTKVVETIKNTHFMFRKLFSEHCAVYEIMWKNNVRVRQSTDDSRIRPMRFACRISTARGTGYHCSPSYCFSTATVVTGTRCSVMFELLVYKHAPSGQGKRFYS